MSRNRVNATCLGVLCTYAVGVGIGCSRPSASVVIPFVARFGNQPFSCNATVEAGGGTFAARDLRFYVHGIQLITADGSVADVTLRNDGAWQNDGVALLDFEDGTGNCRDGTKGTHTAVEGVAREGSYVGIRFTVGIPFERNHANPADAAPPLTLGHMHWDWQAGYKFLRFEGDNPAGSAYRFHLGSTECAGTVGHITGCAHPNRPVIELQGFSPGRSVAVDLNAFLQGINLAVVSRDSVRGCMSGPDATDCAVAFAAIGLDLETGQPLTPQHVFSVL